MIFGLSKKQKRCEKCSVEILEGEGVEHSGKMFCSKEHADEYKTSAEKEAPKKGGCCH